MKIRAVKFRVGHEWRLGALLLPARTGKTAAVLMLHGFPGVQKNEDIATDLCRRGMTVFMPYFRGCWGSPGCFSIHGLLDDAQAALRLLSRYHHVDPQRIGLIGYSLGGWVALRLASQSRLAAAAVLAPAPPRDNEARDGDYLRRSAKVVNIARVEDIWKEYLQAARTDRPDVYIPNISPTPLLFIQRGQDRLVPPAASAKLSSLARYPKQLLEFQNEDHEFQNDRPAVLDALCGWLQSRLAAKRVSVLPSDRGSERPAYR